MEHQYGIDMVGGLIEAIVGFIERDGKDLLNASNDLNESLNKLFIGPDTIFSGKVLIVDANIFKTINLSEYSGWGAAFSDLGDFFNAASDVASPRIQYGDFYKTSNCIYI